MEKPKKWYQERWGKALLVISGLVFIISCGPAPGPSQKTTTEEKTEFNVGETIELKNHQFKVNSVNKNFDTGNPYLKPQKSENVFVTVNVTLTNTSDKDLSVNMFGFELEDETGTQRDITILSGVEGILESVELSPGGTTTGNIPFEAKANSKTLKLHYSPGIGGGKEITVNL